jgi:hypothetical protein
MFSRKTAKIICFLLFFPGIGWAQPDLCTNLNGKWQGSYREETGIYPNSGPWPITFDMFYNPQTHILYGMTDNPFVPVAVSNSGKMDFGGNSNAKILGLCENGKITQLYLYQNKPSCGRYAQPGGKFIRPNVIRFFINYETAMRDLNFDGLLSRDKQSVPFTMPKDMPTKLPILQSCH